MDTNTAQSTQPPAQENGHHANTSNNDVQQQQLPTPNTNHIATPPYYEALPPFQQLLQPPPQQLEQQLQQLQQQQQQLQQQQQVVSSPPRSPPKSPSSSSLSTTNTEASLKAVKEQQQEDGTQQDDASSNANNNNSNNKRVLDVGIPTELDSKKIKKSEMLMNEANEKIAKKILATLLKNPWAPPFECPVDPEALGLPDYFNLIKRPMDLGTINAALNDKKYTTVNTWAEDVRLVFNNAMAYNNIRSDIHKAARGFLNEFDELLKSSGWDQVYDTKIPEVTTPIVTIRKEKATPTKADITHIEEPLSAVAAPSDSKGRTNGSHSRSSNTKNGGYNCLVYYQNETIPYDFEWQQLHSRDEFEQKLRAALSISAMVELEIGIKRSKPNFGREVFVQLSPSRWEDFPKVACVLVKHKKQ